QHPRHDQPLGQLLELREPCLFLAARLRAGGGRHLHRGARGLPPRGDEPWTPLLAPGGEPGPRRPLPSGLAPPPPHAPHAGRVRGAALSGIGTGTRRISRSRTSKAGKPATVAIVKNGTQST